ncbi:glutaredoxin family protein [Haloarcula litorea]|uniref:glutaredoxin family protein n=1 Tax=Haloarcula litorea TaxID=3032579 RepID=UPI0023E7C9E5|nr:glutaredoxin domain-containing protein [Halomicroarcula sp. GDY20]
MSFEPEELSREEVQQTVDETIADNEVALFMKGTELMPQCGYSRKALGLIQQHREDVATVNVLQATEAFREALSEYSGRETIPQTFVDGEFVGGSDILEQLDENGDLESTLRA